MTTTPAEEWVEAGTSVTISAQPDAGFAFARWEGDIVSNEPSLEFTMEEPVTLTAVFEEDLRISNVSIVNNEAVLEVAELPQGTAYDVQRASEIDGTWTTVASDQTGPEYREPLGNNNAFYRLVLAE